MTVQHSKKLDEEKLTFACDLIRRKHEGPIRPVEIVYDALLVMQFGNITAQDMMDFIESAGYE